MRRRSDMARWTLKCENCGFPFPHSLIDDSSAPNYFLPEKPDFPVVGLNWSVLIADMKLRTSCTRLRYRAAVSSGAPKGFPGTVRHFGQPSALPAF
jgi:hypothetical protein